MLQLDKRQFAEMINATFEMYGKQPSKLAVQLFWNVLERFDLEEVKYGFKAHLNDTTAGQFWPKPADIIRHIEGDRQSRTDMGEDAFHRAFDAIGISGGMYATVVFDDPATMYAMHITGGWMNFCQMSEKEKPFRRASCKTLQTS